MKMMIQVKSNVENTTFWVALDSIDAISAFEDGCRIWVGDDCYEYPGTIEQLVSSTKSPAEPRGEMRFVEWIK